MHVVAKVVVLLLLRTSNHVLGQCDSQESNDECSESPQWAHCESNATAGCLLVAIPNYQWQDATYQFNCSGPPAYASDPAWQAFGQVSSYTLDGSEAHGVGPGLSFILYPRKVLQLSMRRYCLETLEPATYRAFLFLTRLEFTDSRVGVVQPNAFEGLSALKELQLARTEFGTMPPGVLRWLERTLQQLDVRSCTGVNFRLRSLTALIQFHLADSEVENLTEMIHPIPASLLRLNVVHVRSSVSPSLFLGTRASPGPNTTTPAALQYVVVVRCALRYAYVQDLPALKMLNISANGLVDGSISVRNLPALERLFATHNKLTQLTAQLFDVGPSLGFVDLSHNGILFVHDCAFGANHRILKLVLQDNPLLVPQPDFRLPVAPVQCQVEQPASPEPELVTAAAPVANFSTRSLASIFDDWTVQDDAWKFGGGSGAGKGTAGMTVLLLCALRFLLTVFNHDSTMIA